MTTWLAIKNYADYQHYKDRKPPWIKLHERLLDDELLNDLDPSARLLYVLLLLVACRKDNVIPYRLDWLSEEISLSRRVIRHHLKSLKQAGFVAETASKPEGYLASRDASATDSNGASNGASPSRTSARSQEAEGERTSARDAASNGQIPEHPFHVPGSGHDDGDWICPIDDFHFHDRAELTEHVDTCHWNTDAGKQALADLERPAHAALAASPDDIPF